MEERKLQEIKQKIENAKISLSNENDLIKSIVLSCSKLLDEYLFLKNEYNVNLARTNSMIQENKNLKDKVKELIK